MIALGLDIFNTESHSQLWFENVFFFLYFVYSLTSCQVELCKYISIYIYEYILMYILIYIGIYVMFSKR